MKFLQEFYFICFEGYLFEIQTLDRHESAFQLPKNQSADLLF